MIRTFVRYSPVDMRMTKKRICPLLAQHCCFDCARKTLFEVDNADPFWTNSDTGHSRKHFLRLLDPGSPLILTKVALRRGGIFGNDSLNSFNSCGSPNLQNLM